MTLADSPDSLVHPSASDRVAVFRALVADSSGSFATGFGETKALFGLRGPVAIDEQFQTALAGLNRDRLKEEFGEWLSDRQIRFLLARRNRILSRCGTMDASGAVGAE